MSCTYDYLVLALGGCTSYFGHPEWEPFAPGLKTLEDALRIRSRVLLAFEKAENTADPAEREALLTIVIVGGGPTGVELAGAFAELARTVLKRDFRRIDPAQARIILIEAAPAVLGHLPPDLAESARRQLEAPGRAGPHLDAGQRHPAGRSDARHRGDHPRREYPLGRRASPPCRSPGSSARNWTAADA